MVTLAGERKIFKLTGVTVEGHKESVKGVLFLTNYRVTFVPIELHHREDPFLVDLFSIPIGCISQCSFTSNAKIDGTYDFVIACKDYRTLYFTPSDDNRKRNLLEPFMRILHSYAFPSYTEKRDQTFAFLFKDPSAEINEFTSLTMKEEYQRQGALYVSLYSGIFCSSSPIIHLTSNT